MVRLHEPVSTQAAGPRNGLPPTRYYDPAAARRAEEARAEQVRERVRAVQADVAARGVAAHSARHQRCPDGSVTGCTGLDALSHPCPRLRSGRLCNCCVECETACSVQAGLIPAPEPAAEAEPGPDPVVFGPVPPAVVPAPAIPEPAHDPEPVPPPPAGEERCGRCGYRLAKCDCHARYRRTTPAKGT